MPIENSSEIGSRGISLCSPSNTHLGSFPSHFISYNDTPNAMNMPYLAQSELPGHLGDTLTCYSSNNFCNISLQDNNHIYLRIVEQPVHRMRFRYESEKGSHGGLMGRNSTSDRKTFPSVKLENFYNSSQVLIKASLYTNENNPKPHVHKLKGPSCQEDGTCLIHLSDDLVACFQNIGISFAGKKSVPEIIFKRKLDCYRVQNPASELSDSLRKKLQKDAELDAKSMNLNSAKICFEAFHFVNQHFSRMCEPVFSDPVSNQKSPDFGELKIVRMSKYSGDCTGGDEVYLLCEKVNKKEVRVRFSESDPKGCIIWEQYGIFNETDVHHQVAIVFRTPPYKTIDIDTSVTVNVQLYRQTDGEASDSVNFVYKPSETEEEGICHKRKKRNPYVSTNGFDGDNILAPQEQKSSFRFSGNHLVHSNNKGVNEHYQSEEISSCLESLFNGSEPWKVPNIGLTESSPDPLLSSANVQLPHVQLGQSSQSSNFSFETDSVETKPSVKYIEEKMNQLFISSKGIFPMSPASLNMDLESTEGFEDGNSTTDVRDVTDENVSPISPASLNMNLESTKGFEHRNDIAAAFGNMTSENLSLNVQPNNSILTEEISCITKVADMPLIKLIQKVWKVLTHFISNGKYEALKKSAQEFLSIFNKDMDNLIHLIVLHQGWNIDLMKSILLLAKNVSPNALNFQNYLKQTPLHLAVLTGNLVFVQMLLKSGSNMNIRDKNGNLTFHIAAETNAPDLLLELLKDKNYLFNERSNHSIDSLNYEGYAPLHYAILYRSKECTRILCDFGADINVVDGKSGRSALHLAVESFPFIVQYLLKQPHIKIDIQDYAGNTPLHLACALRCSSTVSKLMMADANPLIKNFDSSCENNDLGCEVTERGRTPADFADESKELKRILSGEALGSTAYKVTDQYRKMLVQPMNYPNLNENSNHKNELGTKGLNGDYEKECFPSNSINGNKNDEIKDKGSDSGYISGSLLDEQTLLKVCNLLDPPSTAWKDLALWLGVEQQLLNSIEKLQTGPTRKIIEHFWSEGGDSVQLMNAFESANLVEAQNVVKASFSSLKLP